MYWNNRGKDAKTLREDFCGTFALCCEWVKRSDNFEAIGVDNDSGPLAYGEKHDLSLLSPSQKNRLNIFKKDVLEAGLPKADLAVAMNFSYFIFKKRQVLKKYFQNVYKSLNEDGIYLVDNFGGPSCMEANEHETINDEFSYYWDQDNFEPLTNEAQFYIHFKRKGEKKREKVFSYNWRLWSIAEIRDLFEEVGFRESKVYWEQSDEDGDGNGDFKEVQKGEECESWVAYVVGLK